MNGDPVSVHSIAMRLGEKRHISCLTEPVLPGAIRDSLLGNGQCYFSAAADIAKLLVGAVQDTLAASEVPVGDVHRIIFATESMALAGTKAETEKRRAELFELFAEAGLSHAPVTSLTFAGCNGGVESLSLARLLVEAGHADHVLVVTADLVAPGTPRLLRPAVSIVGDGVATAMVDRDPGRRGARIGEYWSRGFLVTAGFRARGDDFGATLVTLGRALMSLGRQMAGEIGPFGPARLLCNNYGSSALRMFTKALGFEANALYDANVARLGHIGDPDVLINLSDVLNEGPGEEDLFLLGTAPTALGCLRVRPEIRGILTDRTRSGS
jgi:3-oxoacyl-[acyl-carrier-protein] synthase III